MNRRVVPHDPNWAKEFSIEKQALAKVFGVTAVAIHHFGSTSIPDILAKPIIDILIEADSLEEIDNSPTA